MVAFILALGTQMEEITVGGGSEDEGREGR